MDKYEPATFELRFGQCRIARSPIPESRKAGLTLVLCGVIAVMTAHTTARGGEQSTLMQSATTASAPTAAPIVSRPIGTIDFYGLHQLSADHLRGVLTFKVGDSIAFVEHSSFFEPSKQNLMMVPGVQRVQVNATCCAADGSVLIYVGIEERNAPAMSFRPVPSGSVLLSPEVVQAGADLERVSMQAVMSGHADEDDSQGHRHLRDFPAAGPAEERARTIARNDLALLRQVLRESADSEQRAVAAELLGYAADMQLVVPDLASAMSDPSGDVRNNAMRALGVFSRATNVRRPQVPYKPFVALLNSPIWTDRNKASLALMSITTKRDPALLRMLRAEALPSLVEMARWSDRGHAYPAFRILGVIAGLSDKEIESDWILGDRERVIRTALTRQS